MEVLDAKGLSERLRWEDNEYWLHLEAETPFEKYPAKQHARRVQEKLGVEEGLIYLPGQPARNNEDSDMPAPFRQRRYFYYLSGCNEPDCHLTYDTRRDELCLFIPRIKPERVIWNGRGSTLAEALVKYDVDQVFYADELEYAVQGWAIGNRQASIYTMHQSSQFPGCENLKPRIDSTALQPAMNICRMIKDDHEIKLIRKANDISSQAHREVLANIAKFKNEAQVEGLFMDVCISHQAKQQAYDPIAASGPNAGTLHYDANNEDLAGRQLMCLDAGCEYELYASDITRSFPLSASWPSKEAENIYKLVQRMQETCIKRLEPGVRYLDLHIMAHQIAIDGLLQLGILHNGTKEEIYKAGTSRAFFPHGLGHHIGLEVHDVGQAQLMSVRRGKPVYQQAPSLYPQNFHIPVYDPETCRAPSDPQSSHLEEGMVVTVEPGIYFSVYALQHFYLPSPIHRNFINVEVLERYMPVGGVRIEDDILITSCGYENLTKAPKGDAMLEIIRHGKSGTIDLPAPNLAPQRRLSGHVEQPMRRAPGISKKTPSQHLQKPLARATTLPADFKQQHDMHVESFAGPSILANFSHSMSTEEKIQQWQRKRNSGETVSCPSTNTKKLQPVCGEISSNVQHVYMGNASSLTSSSRPSREFESTPMCKNCAILVQTLDRLRQNLTNSTHRFPEPEAKHIVKPDLGTKHTPSAAPQIDELSVGASACTINLDKRQRITLPPPRSMLVRPSETREVHRIRRCDTAPLSCKVQAQVPSGQVPRPHAQREQSANNANPDSWRHQTLTATTLPTSAKGCDSKRLPKTLPSAEPLEAEATRQKLESLQLRLHCLEEGARVKRQQQDQAALPDRFLASRPSMPVLASHNPWQQHSAQSLPVGRRGLTNRRSTNIEDHDIARYQQGRYEEGDHQRRFERDALMRDTFFLR
ncbi:putative Xaa-Pro aminopeptidase [Alternaria tenuissima]|uniref:Xaa-Pro aminopeptidase n=1 Tax=Alternaria tenuissima TaxID=119927 RepID=A0AB37WMX0_9PLEO|nr:putative Xaa-Pro aminopeptidase [Alternaria tenuissima]RYO06179.1 putative Xaa-Pro aminopeptidase [Alternaria tenuissima]RYO17840.1 putative Xaa-Pro aminopeptidase [Alternaria tenuissima]